MRTEIFAEMYQKPIYPPNQFPSGKPPRNLTDKIEGAKVALDRLYAQGAFTPPYGLKPEEMSGELVNRVAYAHKMGTLRKD
jgi:hypothetical protein